MKKMCLIYYRKNHMDFLATPILKYGSCSYCHYVVLRVLFTLIFMEKK